MGLKGAIRSHPLAFLFGLAVISLLALLFVPPIPQPQDYHQFADQKILLGIPNFWNVVSNLPFIAVGTMGLKFVMELYATDQVSADLEAPRWIVFSAVPAGSYLMCFRFLQVAWTFWKTGALPHHDETRVEGIVIDTAPAQTPVNGAAR